jgi:hypothetical protein
VHDFELRDALTRSSVLLSRAVLAVGDATSIAVARVSVRARMIATGSRMLVIFVVGGLRRNRFLLDVIGFVSEELGLGVVVLVRANVLEYRDAAVFQRLGGKDDGLVRLLQLRHKGN